MRRIFTKFYLIAVVFWGAVNGFLGINALALAVIVTWLAGYQTWRIGGAGRDPKKIVPTFLVLLVSGLALSFAVYLGATAVRARL